jgi:hypothetical protein
MNMLILIAGPQGESFYLTQLMQIIITKTHSRGGNAQVCGANFGISLFMGIPLPEKPPTISESTLKMSMALFLRMGNYITNIKINLNKNTYHFLCPD